MIRLLQAALAALLLFAGAMFLFVGVPALVHGAPAVEALRLDELVAAGRDAPDFVATDGQLVQLGAPDAHRHGSDLYYPLVDAASARAVAAGAPWRPAAGSPTVLVRSRGRGIPLAAFVAPSGGAQALPRALAPFRAQGRRWLEQPPASVRTSLLGRAASSDGSGGSTIIIDLDSTPIDRASGLMFSLLGLAALYFCRSMWRRLRARRRAAVARSREPSPVRPKRSIPWAGVAKVAGVVAIGAIALSKAGGRVADDVAPGMRDVAAAAKAADLAKAADATNPTALERATDAAKDLATTAVGQATNIKTAAEVTQRRGKPTDRGSGELRVERMDARYTAVREIQGQAPPLPTYSLARDSSRIEFRVGSASERLDSDLPDRDLGEYDWIQCEPGLADGAVREDYCTIRFETGLRGPDGWIDPISMRCEARITTGSWSQLASGTPCELELTEDGAQAWAKGWDRLMEAAVALQSATQKARHIEVQSSTSQGPRLRLSVDRDQLTVQATDGFRSRVSVQMWR